VRDLRLDFLRGLAIYTIFIDHVPGDPLAKFTYRMVGFSDAAEIFVFISGLACGIGYSRIFARGGSYGLTGAIGKRLARIYVYYAFSSVVMILLVNAAMEYMSVLDSFGIQAEQPASAITSALLLLTPPPLSGILVLYIVLTCLVVPPLVVSHGRYQNFALGVSALIWVASQFPTEHVSFFTQKLFFNPFAWQFLFAIGVTLGINRENKSPTLEYLLTNRMIIVTAWTIALGALFVKILSFHSFFDVAALRLEPDTAERMKQNLAPLRLVHFISVAFLVAVYFRRDSALLRSLIARPLIMMGAHSLQVFSLSVVLTIALNLFVTGHPLSVGSWLVANSLVFLLLALAAFALQHIGAYSPLNRMFSRDCDKRRLKFLTTPQRDKQFTQS